MNTRFRTLKGLSKLDNLRNCRGSSCLIYVICVGRGSSCIIYVIYVCRGALVLFTLFVFVGGALLKGLSKLDNLRNWKHRIHQTKTNKTDKQ
jgi:hypothetical protein